MAENKQPEVTDKDLFTNLVMMLSSSAMQQMGKIANPMTQQTEVNLEGAQISIDMLTMLQNKTSGNLEDDEKKMLSDILSSLQMTFVETRKEQGGQPASGESQTGQEQPAATKEESSKETGREEDGEKKSKYHKSYGES
jgi:hypothetical protein